ncbi:hypothetical protein AGDE_15704 [Angomonas deanei]|uniref:Uncharacterized protein n=1 Tax=Angomonas deanei TaxID=59799 RepID=A0A7G2CSX3_9TRYP|nr:hypothetical protein AGDE_15704 [Angomonas deanei]CAD2222327.1 hypothetical protein, conserved [Angomonas deanei]|eukprot:EPY18637.1 hypothetical protein AGDE_15704 [Angomonas deanei]
MNLLVEIVVEHINVNYKEQHKVSYRRLPSSVASIGLPKNQTIRTEKKTENNNTAKKEEKKVPEKKETPTSNNNHIKKNSHSLPPFTITHRGRIDFSDAWNFKLTEKRIGVPEELVVEIDFQNKNNHNSLRAADLQVEVSADGTCLEIVPTEQQTLLRVHGVTLFRGGRGGGGTVS